MLLDLDDDRIEKQAGSKVQHIFNARACFATSREAKYCLTLLSVTYCPRKTIADEATFDIQQSCHGMRLCVSPGFFLPHMLSSLSVASVKSGIFSSKMSLKAITQLSISLAMILELFSSTK
jgi:nitrate reductase beta subunit